MQMGVSCADARMDKQGFISHCDYGMSDVRREFSDH